jgi:hypothetical protein
MRFDRVWIRFLKVAILIGSVGIFIEGLFELKILIKPIFDPPSIPGQSKIYEHFLIQHFSFPLIGLLLVFKPINLTNLVKSKIAMYLLASIAILVTIPEAIVSYKDLFRPYPFNLHSNFLKHIQMIEFENFSLNLLQLQHLIFAHFFLMGTIFLLSLFGVKFLQIFAGPRTGEESFKTQ